MTKAGCRLACEFFHGNQDPQQLHFFEDYDLWRSALPDTKDFHFAMESRPRSIEERDRIMSLEGHELTAFLAAGHTFIDFLKQIGFCTIKSAYVGLPISVPNYKVTRGNFSIVYRSEERRVGKECRS